MAPFLSFTAEEAWQVLGHDSSIFAETYWQFEPADAQALSRWSRIREIREAVNRSLEDLRKGGGIGSSLQADLLLGVNPQDHQLLQSLGADLKFVFITSSATLAAADELTVTVTPATAQKCERCWHYSADVGSIAAHPTICGRCDSNLHGSGEIRQVA
jgi:isoleucyl-tRNA synthetase